MDASWTFEWGAKLPTLRGEAVELRPLEASDIGDLFTIFGDAEVMRYWSRPPFDSLQTAAGFLEEIHVGFAQRQLFQWGIVEAASPGVAGTCTLFAFDPAHWRCEIGFALARHRWGRAIAQRAIATVLRFAFDSLGVHRVEADVDPRNDRSLRLLERLGFAREGYLRERYRVNGEIQDSVILGLLRSEWSSPRLDPPN